MDKLDLEVQSCIVRLIISRTEELRSEGHILPPISSNDMEWLAASIAQELYSLVGERTTENLNELGVKYGELDMECDELSVSHGYIAQGNPEQGTISIFRLDGSLAGIIPQEDIPHGMAYLQVDRLYREIEITHQDYLEKFGVK